MIVWQIIGNEIGPNGNGAAFYAKKSDASRVLRDYNAAPGDHPKGADPVKLEIRSREELAAALNDAMGYGCT